MNIEEMMFSFDRKTIINGLQVIDEKIKNYDKDGFREYIEIFLRKLLGYKDDTDDTIDLKNPLHKWLHETLKLQVGGVNYLSHGLGEWFRIRFGKWEEFSDNLELSKTEEDVHEDVYSMILPADINLTVCAWLSKRVVIKIGHNNYKNDESFRLSISDIQLIRNFFKKIGNFNRYIKSSKRISHYLNDNEYLEIKKLCEPWGNYLDSRGFREYIAEKNFSEIEKVDILFRILALFLYRTIYLKRNLLFGGLTIILTPFKDFPGNENIVRNYGSFVGVFKRDPSEIDIDNLTNTFKYFIIRLSSIELTSKDITRRDLVVVENIIRLCTHIGMADHLNIVGKKLKEWLNVHSDDKEAEKIKSNFIGCNNKFIEMLEGLKDIVESKNEEGQPSLKKGICIFLYSEPGLGKEAIAKLCHLLSPRTTEKELLVKHMAQLPKALNKYSFCKETSVGSSSGFKEEKWRRNKLFNFFPCHAGLLNRDNIERVLFGSEEKEPYLSGYFLNAHSMAGTIFIDELNTLKENALANIFLRVTAEPYEILPVGRMEEIKINVLTIFSSNDRPAILKSKDMNPALITRITKNYFEIIPLRERKEDIALLINHLIKIKKEEYAITKSIIEIELSGLKLLCELRWENNIRGIQGFIDDLILNRKNKNIQTSVISFDEIIECIKKRESLILK